MRPIPKGSWTIPICLLAAFLAGLPVEAGASTLSRAPYRPHLTLVCNSSGWAIVGGGWRIASVQLFVAAGGKVVGPAVKQAGRMPNVQYWVLPNPGFLDTCNHTSTRSIELGRNARDGTYLLAISISPLVPGSAVLRPPLPSPLHRGCALLQPTRYTSHVVSPQHFWRELSDYGLIRKDTRAIVATSAWQTIQRNLSMTVFAGANGLKSQRRNGSIFVIMSNSCTGQLGPASMDTTSQATGPLTLKSVRGTIVSFTFKGGHGTLNLSNHRFAISAGR